MDLEIGEQSGWLRLCQDAHELSGRSERSVAVACDVDHSTVNLILNGRRVPTRDTLLLLCLRGWSLSPAETDEILIAARYCPLTPSAKRAGVKNLS